MFRQFQQPVIEIINAERGIIRPKAEAWTAPYTKSYVS